MERHLFIYYISFLSRHPPGQAAPFSLFCFLSSTITTSMSSPPPSPLRMTLTVSTVANAFIKFRRARDDALDFASGIPITHPSLCGEDATSKRTVSLEHADRYVCKDAVDVTKLLRGSRASLLEKAVLLGANVLVEERWVSRRPSRSLFCLQSCLLAAQWLWRHTGECQISSVVPQPLHMRRDG